MLTGKTVVLGVTGGIAAYKAADLASKLVHGSEAAKMREERLARKGKAIDSAGKIVPLAKYEADQQRLYEEAERARATAPKRQQPVSKQRAKKQAQKGRRDGASGPTASA